MRKPILILLSLVGLAVGWAQINYGYHYWFDKDFDNRVTGTLTAESTDVNADISQLSYDLHTLCIQLSKDSILSSPMPYYFVKVPTSTQTWEVYVDNELFETFTSNPEEGEVAHTIDVMSLSFGLHLLSVQAAPKEGGRSSAFARYFVRIPTEKEYANAKCYYYLDDNDEYIEAGVPIDGLLTFSADGSELSMAENHIIHCFLVLEDGTITSEFAKGFTLEVPPFVPDTYPMATNLAATTSIAEGVSLTWDGVDDELSDLLQSAIYQGYTEDKLFSLTGYNVYRNGEDTPLNAEMLATTSYTDADANLLEPNYYAVSVVYSNGYETELCDSVYAMQRVARPTISVADEMVTITCATEESNIYYTLDESEPTADATLYIEPFALPQNCIINAIAQREGWLDSDIATYSANGMQCSVPEIVYNGRYATLSGDEGCTFYYALDGEEGKLYVEPFDVMAAQKIEAWAVKDNFNDSDVATYAVPSYYDGETATVYEPGTLDVAFAWAADILDSQVWIRLSGDANEADAEQLSRLSSLGAVIWDWDNLAVPAKLLDFNDNLLLYVNDAALATDCGVRNVVINRYASEITLDGGGNFWVPQEFTADKAEYTRSFTMFTALDGDTQGWETLTLPFDVTTIEHLGGAGVYAKGEIRPFAAFATEDFSEAKPFWLHKLDGQWNPADCIEAYVPYVISMPYNPYYGVEYQLAGEVRFEAENVTFPVTEINSGIAGEYRLVGSMVRQEADEALAPVNATYAGGEAVDTGDFIDGSAFVPGLRDVCPFEAYLTSANGSRMGAPVRVADLGGSQLSIPSVLQGDYQWRVWCRDGVMYISTGVAQRVTLYNVHGQALRVLDLVPGVNEVYDLTTGIYIVKNSKVFVEMKHLN